MAVACDSKDKAGDDKADGKKADAKKTDAKKVDAKKADAKKADDKKADEKKAEPPKPKIVACDQRDFIPEGTRKMAEQMGKEPKPKFVCMDHSKRTSPRPPSCVQGKILETPCPDEGVIATCTLAATGVVYKHYEGASAAIAEKSCTTIEGTFAKVK